MNRPYPVDVIYGQLDHLVARRVEACWSSLYYDRQISTQRQDALKYVHTGWIVALLSGGATWVAAQSLISISGASREVMEGVAALFAALVLFYVGIWMHSKTHAAQWQAYIQKHVNERLKSGTLWGLAALSFIAVYREVFETVLFYESLLTQAVEAQYSVVAGGFLLGVAMLAARPGC